MEEKKIEKGKERLVPTINTDEFFQKREGLLEVRARISNENENSQDFSRINIYEQRLGKILSEIEFQIISTNTDNIVLEGLLKNYLLFSECILEQINSIVKRQDLYLEVIRLEYLETKNPILVFVYLDQIILELENLRLILIHSNARDVPLSKKADLFSRVNEIVLENFDLYMGTYDVFHNNFLELFCLIYGVRSRLFREILISLQRNNILSYKYESLCLNLILSDQTVFYFATKVSRQFHLNLENFARTKHGLMEIKPVYENKHSNENLENFARRKHGLMETKPVYENKHSNEKFNFWQFCLNATCKPITTFKNFFDKDPDKDPYQPRQAELQQFGAPSSNDTTSFSNQGGQSNLVFHNLLISILFFLILPVFSNNINKKNIEFIFDRCLRVVNDIYKPKSRLKRIFSFLFQAKFYYDILKTGGSFAIGYFVQATILKIINKKPVVIEPTKTTEPENNLYYDFALRGLETVSNWIFYFVMYKLGGKVNSPTNLQAKPTITKRVLNPPKIVGLKD